MILTISMHWTHDRRSPMVRAKGGSAMRANDIRPAEILRHGAYVCLRVPDGARRAAAAAAVPALTERLGLRNEFAAGDGPPADAIAFLRRIGATSADIADDGLLHA